jgi:hypothetical protein
VPVDKIVWMIGEYRTRHMGWNVKHFHEYLRRQYGFGWATPGPSGNCSQRAWSIVPEHVGRIVVSGRASHVWE